MGKNWSLQGFLRGMRVKKRLLMAFLLIAVLPFALICVYILQSVHSSQRHRDREYAGNYARQSLAGMNQMLTSLYDTFDSFAGNSDILADVYNYTRDESYRKQDVEDRIRSTIWSGVSTNRAVAFALVYTQDGEVFQTSERLSDDRLEQMLGQSSIHGVDVDLIKLEGVPYMLLSRQIMLRYDQPDIALSLLAVDLRHLSAQSRAFLSEEGQELWMLDGEGRVLIHPDEGRLLSAMTPPEGAIVDQWAPGGFQIVNQVDMNSSGDMVPLMLAMAGVGLVTLPLLTLLFQGLSQSITDPAQALLEQMEHLGREELLDTAVPDDAREAELGDEMAQLEREFHAMVRRIRSLIQTVYLKRISEQELQYKIRELELNALQQQINPHFLYNVLDNIFWRAQLGGNQETAGMITALGSYFKTSTDPGFILVTVDSELQNIRSYLYLQQHMLGDRFAVRWDIEEAVSECLTIKLILQPAIENAIVHGFRDMECGGLIEVGARREGDRIVFTIRDNGAGMEPDQLNRLREYVHSRLGAGKSVGLRNVQGRIHTYYGDREGCGIQIESQKGRGTTIRIGIPMQRSEDSNV